MTYIDTPAIQPGYSGIPFTLDRLEALFYVLAAAYGEEDYDGIAELVKCARRHLTHGATVATGLTATLISRELTGSNVAGRELADMMHRRSGVVNRRFEHNTVGRPQSPLFPGLTITVHQAMGAPDIFVMELVDPNHQRPEPLEKTVAEAMGIERAITGITVTFSLPKVNGGKQFRFDIAPFIDGLSDLGIGPICYADSTVMDGQTAADRMMTMINRCAEQRFSPTLYFDTPKHLGLEVTLTPYGCGFADYDLWEHERTVHCTRNGTVFTGPIKPDSLDPAELEEPIMYFHIRQAPLVDGGPPQLDLVTEELQAPLRLLARQIASAVRR